MNKPAKMTVLSTSVPEVEEYEEAERRVENWKRTYPGAYEELKELLEYRNTKLEAADKVVRAKQVGCSEWKINYFKTNVDANALLDAVGKEEFLRLGGSIQTIHQYDIDKKQFEAAVVQGKVTREIVDKVVTHSPTYSSPKKTEIP